MMINEEVLPNLCEYVKIFSQEPVSAKADIWNRFETRFAGIWNRTETLKWFHGETFPDKQNSWIIISVNLPGWEILWICSKTNLFIFSGTGVQTAEDTHRRTYLKGSWSRNNKKCYILHNCNTLFVILPMSSTLWLSLHNAEGKGRCHINVPLLKGDKTQTQCQIIKFYKQLIVKRHFRFYTISQTRFIQNLNLKLLKRGLSLTGKTKF